MLKNYLNVAVKVLLRRKFYTAVSLFGIAFTLLILNVCVAFIDHVLEETQMRRLVLRRIRDHFRAPPAGADHAG